MLNFNDLYIKNSLKCHKKIKNLRFQALWGWRAAWHNLMHSAKWGGSIYTLFQMYYTHDTRDAGYFVLWDVDWLIVAVF